MSRPLVFSITLWLACAAHAAAACDGDRPPEDAGRDERAQFAFEAGRSAYADGRFEQAEECFRLSYELSERPALLYNLATAADQARHDCAALRAYREFVERMPDSERRERAENRITHLAPMCGGGGGGDPAPWIVTAGGGAVAIVGAILIGVAAADVAYVESAMSGTPWSDVQEAYFRSEPLSIAGVVLLVTGVAVGVAGVTWGVVGSSSGGGASVRAGPLSLSLEGTF